eukprot:gene8446-11424_t
MSGQCCCFCCFQWVNEMNAGVLENCGKFEKVVPAGFVCVLWPCYNISAAISLKINQVNVVCDSKTKDNVFVKIIVGVLYKTMPDKVPAAYYKLSDPQSQIRSYVFDVIRSTVPTMDLDNAFASKDDIANAVKKQLTTLMADYGYEIVATLVVDIDPDVRVKDAMNDIMASMRMREAMSEKADADKILQVKAAEAEAESKYLSGLGVAKQRKAIIDGLRDTVGAFTTDVEGTTPHDVMDLLLLTQYFDMIRDIGKTPKTAQSTIFLPHGPQSVGELRNELTKHFMTNMKNTQTTGLKVGLKG